MLIKALENLNPDYIFRGSCTANNKTAFDALRSLSGTKPSWEDVETEMALVAAQRVLDEEKEQDKINAIASHPIADMTPIEAMNWVENTVIADDTVKDALKQIFKLTQARR